MRVKRVESRKACQICGPNSAVLAARARRQERSSKKAVLAVTDVDKHCRKRDGEQKPQIITYPRVRAALHNFEPAGMLPRPNLLPAGAERAI